MITPVPSKKLDSVQTLCRILVGLVALFAVFMVIQHMQEQAALEKAKVKARIACQEAQENDRQMDLEEERTGRLFGEVARLEKEKEDLPKRWAWGPCE
jgi:hypothetical protein